MNWTQIRAQYPALSQRTYLNTAACGLVSQATWTQVQAFWQDLLQNGGLHRMDWEKQIEDIRQLLADSIAVPAQQLALLPNFTVGLNYAAQLLQPTQSVLLVEGEYSSVTLPWKLMGYPCHTLPLETNGAIPIEKLAEALEQTQAQILAISHVQWHTGYRIPLDQLSQLCRNRGVTLVVDATQSWGMVPINLQETPVDIFVSSGYKWPTAGFGSAIMYLSEKIWREGNLPVIGQGSTFLMEAGQVASTETLPPAGMEAGHRDYAGLIALGHGWRELEQIGLDQIETRILGLVEYLHQQAAKVGWEVLSDYAPAHRSGILSLAGEAAWVDRFAERGVDISFREGRLRVSIHFYNEESDIDRLMEVYQELGQ